MDSADQLRERLQRELTPEQWAEVVQLIGHTDDDSYAARERTVDALAAHFPALPIRVVAEHVFAVDSSGTGRCGLCPISEAESAGA